MSDQEAAMGNESPIVEGLENYPEPLKQKGKGGKTKEVNNARGIPEAIRLKMGYDTPPEESDHDRRFDCKGFDAIGLSGGTSTRASQLGSGQCSLLSAHLIGTPPL